MDKKQMDKKHYYKNITGLRGIAVLSIMLFHIFPKSLVGGFLGVDIFFVISGYLITEIMLREQEKQDNINLLNFYKRRFLRIWPASIVLLLIVGFLGYMFLCGGSLITLAKSIIYSILGIANFYFYYFLDTSYFAPAVNTNLLLHLWSLGVESQFYLFFPFLILIIKRKYLLSTFIILFLVSVIAASVISRKNLMFSYYMLPTRAFALLLGAIGAYIVMYKRNYLKVLEHKSISNVIGILSLILIVITFLLIKGEKFKLPNYFTLLAIIPTILLILIGRINSNVLTNKLLETKIIYYIGLWSFSIYLYHWVFVALWHINYNGKISLLYGSIIFIVSIIAGALSYYLIEQTFLKRKWNIFVTILILLIIPYIAAVSYQYVVKAIYKKYRSFLPTFGSPNICLGEVKELLPNNFFQERCISNKMKGEPNVLLFGDSNSCHYVPAIELIAKKLNFSFRNIALGSCSPLFKTDIKYVTYLQNQDACSYGLAKCYEIAKNYDVIIFSSRMLDPFYMMNKNINLFKYELEKNITDLLKTAKIIILLSHAYCMNHLYIDEIIAGKEPRRSFIDFYSFQNQDVRKVNLCLKEIANKYDKVYYVDFSNMVCNEKFCLFHDGRHSFYTDKDHYSTYGAIVMGERYIKQGIDKVWYKVKNIFKDRTDIKLLPNGKFINTK